MPIRIILLAEAQTAAEMRRKDPVIRSIWVGVFLVLLVGIWIGQLQMDIMFEHSKAGKIDGDWKSLLVKYASVTNEITNTAAIDRKLAQLDRLTTNRFLWGPVLNALQKTMVDQVQVTRIRGEQTIAHADARDVGTGANRRHFPSGMIEKVNLYIEAKDLRPNDQNYTKYKENLCNFEFFLNRLQRRDGFVMDGVLGPLTVDPVDPSKAFVTFALVSHFPEEHQDE